jgi:glucan phosphoethanolaminetransferase (alkaline phosphatase superfamily)
MTSRQKKWPVVAEWPAEPKTNDSKHIAWFYAAIITVLTALQLFTIDTNIESLKGLGLTDAARRLWLVAGVVLGVFALPFLLRMKLSVGLRWCSMWAGWAIPILGGIYTVWLNLTGVSTLTFSVAGNEFGLFVGWWMIFLNIGMGLLAAWASWGLWPARSRRAKRTHSIAHNR